MIRAIGFLALWALFLVWLLVTFSCAGPRPRVVEKVVQVPITVRCLKTPRPAHATVPPPTECNPGVMCWPIAAFQDLVDNVERLLEWSADAEHACLETKSP